MTKRFLLASGARVIFLLLFFDALGVIEGILISRFALTIDGQFNTGYRKQLGKKEKVFLLSPSLPPPLSSPLF